MPNKHQQLNVKHRVETNAVTTDLYEYFWWCVKMANAFLQCVHEWGCLLLIRLDGCGTWLLWGGGGGYIIYVLHITRCARMYVVRLKLYVRMIIVQCVPTSQSHFSSNLLLLLLLLSSSLLSFYHHYLNCHYHMYRHYHYCHQCRCYQCHCYYNYCIIPMQKRYLDQHISSSKAINCHTRIN